MKSKKPVVGFIFGTLTLLGAILYGIGLLGNEFGLIFVVVGAIMSAILGIPGEIISIPALVKASKEKEKKAFVFSLLGTIFSAFIIVGIVALIFIFFVK